MNMQLSMTALGRHCGYRFYRFCFPLGKFYGNLSPWKGKRSLYYRCVSSYLHSEGSSATLFVRSFRSFALPYFLITWRFLPERYRYLQCAKAVLVCYTNWRVLTTNLTFEEQRKRKSTINILQFYHYIRLLSRNRKTEVEVARIYPIRKYMSGGTSCRIIWINSHLSAI